MTDLGVEQRAFRDEKIEQCHLYSKQKNKAELLCKEILTPTNNHSNKY